jgi:uncharacterized protein
LAPFIQERAFVSPEKERPVDLTQLQMVYFFLAALIVGFTKTSVGGLGILAVLLMALAFPGKASPGVLLPMLIAADIMAVIHYRRSCRWKILLKLLPMTAAGVLIGYFLVDIIPVGIFEMVLGMVILAMLGFDMLASRYRVDVSGSRAFTGFTGLVAGVATMMANAAGPVFGVYLLKMGLSKNQFVGTRSWFFLVINIFKVPFSASLGLITPQTLVLNLWGLPVILLGAYLGFRFLQLINLDIFKWLIRAAVLVAAIRLIAF